MWGERWLFILRDATIFPIKIECCLLMCCRCDARRLSCYQLVGKRPSPVSGLFYHKQTHLSTSIQFEWLMNNEHGDSVYFYGLVTFYGIRNRVYLLLSLFTISIQLDSIQVAQ